MLKNQKLESVPNIKNFKSHLILRRIWASASCQDRIKKLNVLSSMKLKTGQNMWNNDFWDTGH